MASLFFVISIKVSTMPKGLPAEELIRIVTENAIPAAASLGLELWGVEISSSGRPVLRVFVEQSLSEQDEQASSDVGDVGKEKQSCPDDESADILPLPELRNIGVGIEQCAELSRMLGLALDVEDIFPDAWILEVSSPGMDRPFFRPQQLPPYIGQELEVALSTPHPDFPGRRKFRGQLAAVSEEHFTLRIDPASSIAAGGSGNGGSGNGGSGTDNSGNDECSGGHEVIILWDRTRKVRLIPHFPDTIKPGQGKRSPKKIGTNSGQGGGKQT